MSARAAAAMGSRTWAALRVSSSLWLVAVSSSRRCMRLASRSAMALACSPSPSAPCPLRESAAHTYAFNLSSASVAFSSARCLACNSSQHRHCQPRLRAQVQWLLKLDYGEDAHACSSLRNHKQAAKLSCWLVCMAYLAVGMLMHTTADKSFQHALQSGMHASQVPQWGPLRRQLSLPHIGIWLSPHISVCL